MLDPRLYRASFAPTLLALVVAAFSLQDRPRPLQATLAPDAFDGARAFARLQGLATQYPSRRPGSTGDTGLARTVERELRAAFCPRDGGGAAGECASVVLRRVAARTIDGDADLETVVATRLGAPGPGLLVVAHRDAARPPAAAELSGTAALLELARVFAGRPTERTLTLASTSGGTGGSAAAADLAARPPEGVPTPGAVLVLGDLASASVRRPWVLPWSSGSELAPVRLRRTVEQALRVEAGAEPGTPRALAQIARLAFPFAQSEQGPFNAAGIPAVTISATAERGPESGAAVSEERLRAFGRAALRTIDALDDPEADLGQPSAEVGLFGKVLPPWIVRLLVGALLLPMVVAAVDGLARVRRRRVAVAVWLRWLAALALPFAAVLAAARLLGATGALAEAPSGAVRAGLVPTDPVFLGILGAVLILGTLAVRPLHNLLAARPEALPAVEREGGGPAAALALVITALAVAVWAVNPYAAAALLLPAHLWMLAAVPEVRLGRLGALAIVLLALLPALLVLAVFASSVGASITALPWALVLLVAGGEVGAPALAAVAVLGACALGALRLAGLPTTGEAPPDAVPSVRGPMGHAGPGSLGGTASGFGRRGSRT